MKTPAPHPLDAEISRLERQLYCLRQKRKSDRMRAAIKAMWSDPERRAARVGIFRRDETRAKVGAIVRERLADPKARKRLSAQAAAQWADPDTRERMVDGIVKARRRAVRPEALRDPVEKKIFGDGARA